MHKRSAFALSVLVKYHHLYKLEYIGNVSLLFGYKGLTHIFVLSETTHPNLPGG